jgi:hypothetical protein
MVVMAGFVPAIPLDEARSFPIVIAGTSPAMTCEKALPV